MTHPLRLASSLTLVSALLAAVPATAQQKPVTVGFVPKLINIGYFNAMQKGAQQAADKLGVKLVTDGPTQADAAAQVQIVKQLIAQHVDALAVAPDDPSTVVPAFAQAAAQGIKVLTTDTDAPQSGRLVFVNQAKDTAIGDATIDALAKDMGEQGEWAIDSCGAAAQNLNGWIAVEKSRAAQKYPKMRLVATVYSGEDQAKATSDSKDLMTAHPQLRGIVGQCTTSAPGVADAVTQLRKIGKVFVTGVALPSSMKPYVESGAAPSFVLWDPVKLGYLTVWAGVQLARNIPFKAENDVPGVGTVAYDMATKTLLLGPPIVFNKDNVGKYDF